MENHVENPRNTTKNAAETQGKRTMDEASEGVFDFTYVDATARIALYDDLKSAPRITEIPPGETDAFIEALASAVYEQAHASGGAIPYTVIREVSENFIHAQFAEMVVTILDRGNTIRFADQGPGIPNKENAQLPGFSSAREPMKKYIRGVGSGLPIVKEYLEFSHGSITIEDNLGRGSVVTLSVSPETAQPQPNPAAPFLQGMHPGAGEMPPPAAMQGGSCYQGAPAGAQSFPQQAYQQGFAPAYPRQGAAVPSYAQSYPVQQVTAANPGYATFDPVQANAMAALSGISDRERLYLRHFRDEGALGVTEVCNLTGDANSTAHNTLTRMEEAGLLEKVAGKKRSLTAYGRQIAMTL